MTPSTLKSTIERQIPIREMVYLYLRDEILRGRIKPTSRIVEAEIAKQIGTSRTPVREAFHLLEKEGFLEAIQRVGYRVKSIDWDELVEICEIRVINETLAAQWAIDRIQDDEIQAMAQNLASAEAEIRGGNPRSFVQRDAEFHEILVRAGGSKRLFDFCELLRRHMLRYRIEGLVQEKAALRALGEHHRILKCIKTKDKNGVALALREHLEMVKSSIHDSAFKDTKNEEDETPT